MAPTIASSGPELLARPNIDSSAVSWMETNWMFLSWAFALFGTGLLVARVKQRDAYWYGWLAVVMYCFHQSEEHGYDFRGWRYAFVPYMNEGIGTALFASLCAEGQSSCPLDPKMTLYINTMMIWVGFSGTMLAAPAYPEKFLLAGSLSWDTAVVNGLGGHVAPAAASVSYNPGLVQSLVMVPLGIFIIRASGRPWLCLANGLGAHIIAFGVGINLMYRAGLPEAPAMVVFDLLGGLALPLGLSYALNPHTADAYK